MEKRDLKNREGKKWAGEAEIEREWGQKQPYEAEGGRGDRDEGEEGDQGVEGQLV